MKLDTTIFHAALGLLLCLFSVPEVSGQNLKAEFEMKALRQQVYKLKFAGRPGAEKFQITRLPTASWSRRDNFLLEVGEDSPDKQFKVESFEERQAKNREGDIVDVSEVNIIYLKTGKPFTLVRNVDCVIPTNFGELVAQSNPGKRFYVKEGEEFTVPALAEITFRLVKVEKDLSLIHAFKDGKLIEKFELNKKK